jgi:hypothetical protein
LKAKGDTGLQLACGVGGGGKEGRVSGSNKLEVEGIFHAGRERERARRAKVQASERLGAAISDKRDLMRIQDAP